MSSYRFTQTELDEGLYWMRELKITMKLVQGKQGTAIKITGPTPGCEQHALDTIISKNADIITALLHSGDARVCPEPHKHRRHWYYVPETRRFFCALCESHHMREAAGS